MAELIRVRDLLVRRNGRKVCAVAELDVGPGERVAVHGPNGSGKSTLLRVLGSLESADGGDVQVAAAPSECVYVHQSPWMFRGTVLGNVTWGLAARGVGRRDRERLGHEWLERLELQKLDGRQGTRLSGGEVRRVALARAMIMRPAVLLLDEPLADLDAGGQAAVGRALAAIPETTVLMASPTAIPPGLTSRHYDLTAPSTPEPNQDARPPSGLADTEF